MEKWWNCYIVLLAMAAFQFAVTAHVSWCVILTNAHIIFPFLNVENSGWIGWLWGGGGHYNNCFKIPRGHSNQTLRCASSANLWQDGIRMDRWVSWKVAKMSWKSHGIVFSDFCGNPDAYLVKKNWGWESRTNLPCQPARDRTLRLGVEWRKIFSIIVVWSNKLPFLSWCDWILKQRLWSENFMDCKKQSRSSPVLLLWHKTLWNSVEQNTDSCGKECFLHECQ